MLSMVGRALRYAWQYVYCMVCGMMGELTKLRAYGFQFWFQVLGFQKRSSGRLQSTHHSQLAWECLTLIMILCFEFNTRKLCLTYDTFYKSSFSNVLKEIFSRDFWVVTSWYQSLGLRDSGALPSVPELKLRKWYIVFKRKIVVTEEF